jgi:putative FmdB family regulatory protein
MPTYDYRCLACRRKFDKFLTYQDYETAQVACPFCKSAKVTRAIGRVRVTRGSFGHLADMADPAVLDQIDDDPKKLGQMMREMKSEVGAELGGEFDEVVDRLEKGQSPDEIDQAFPDFGGGGEG